MKFFKPNHSKKDIFKESNMKKAIQTLWNNLPLRHIIPMLALVLVMTEPSYAQNFDGIQTTLDAIVQAITGPLGIAVATLAVVAVGVVFMMGRMDWMFAASIVLGIAVMFGAANFVAGFNGGG
jgi:type IV secretion system protein VirB2